MELGEVVRPAPSQRVVAATVVAAFVLAFVGASSAPDPWPEGQDCAELVGD